MKKSVIILSLALVIAMFASMTVNAGWQGTSTLPTISLNTGAAVVPTIDGNITDDEGWSAKSPFDETSVGHFWAQMPLSTVGEFRFAADDNGLYFAMAVAENGSAWKTDENGNNTEYFYEGNTFVFSTGEDMIDKNAEGKPQYGYNGDVIVFSIDPARVLYNAGYTDNSDKAPWYCIGVFEDQTVKVYHELIIDDDHIMNNADITAQCKAAGKGGSDINGQAGGCNVEVFIPWDIIIKDVNDLAEINADDIKISKKDIMNANGVESKATVIYQDRYYDSELRDYTTWGRYITVPETLPSGLKGSAGSGSDIQSYGVTLNISAAGGDTPESTDPAATDPTSDTTTTNGTTSGTTAATTTTGGSSSGSKSSSSSGSKSGSSSSGSKSSSSAANNQQANTTTETATEAAATTLDTGIVVSAAVLAASAGAFIFLNKKGKKDNED